MWIDASNCRPPWAPLVWGHRSSLEGWGLTARQTYKRRIRNCNSNLTLPFSSLCVLSPSLPQLQCRDCSRDSRPIVAWAEWRHWHHRSPVQPSICPRCHDNVGLRRGGLHRAHGTTGESGDRMRKECSHLSHTRTPLNITSERGQQRLCHACMWACSGSMGGWGCRGICTVEATADMQRSAQSRS